MFIDVNASYGPWPFAPLGCETLAELDQNLAEHQIEQALVSPLRSVFYLDPHPANQELFEQASQFSRIHPIPTLNPSLANCLEQFEAYRSTSSLKAIKLYPNFHHYKLNSKRCNTLCAALESLGLPLILSLRLEDERHAYRGLRIRKIPVKQVAALAKRFPKLPLLCLGLYFDEIKELSQTTPHFRTDLSFADWHHLIPRLLEFLKPEQLLFGSHTPLMVTQANTYKLTASPISPNLKAQIAHQNARDFFQLR